MTGTAWLHDARHGLRGLVRAPSFAVTALLSVALGIGATTAIFSATSALLLRPLPYPDAGRIAIVWQRSPGLDISQDWLSIGQYLDIVAENGSFDRVTAAIGASFNLTEGGGRPERVDGIRATSSFFALFGARAALGRVFTADDDVPGGEQQVILTDAFWRRRFGADPEIVGRTVTLNGRPVAVAGVLAPGFEFGSAVMPAVNAIQRTDFILPLPLAPDARATRNREDYNVFVRLKDDVSLERAQADLDAIAARMRQAWPASYPAGGGLTLSAVPLLGEVVGDVRLALYVLLGSAGLLLLIACGNVANLLLARAATREAEVAVRAAVGGSRARIVRQLLTESLTLAALGGAAGLALAFAGITAIRLIGAAVVPRAQEIALDLRVLGFASLVSLLTAVAFGLVPALKAARVDPNTVLRAGGRGASGTGHGRLRATLVAAEVALSVMLLAGAGLLVRSYARITAADPGFDPRHVLSFRLSLPAASYQGPEAVLTFYRELDRRVAALPGVEAVATNYQLPLSSVALAWEPIGVEGYVPRSAADELIITSSAYISADYFRVMGMALMSGRTFDERDTRESPPVVIVDDRLAARFWPGESALGKRLRRGADGPWRTVVGVVANTREYEPLAQPPITAYFPSGQYGIGSRFVVVRTVPHVEAASVLDAVMREVHALDPDLPAYDVKTMEARLGDSLARRRLSMGLLVAFGGLALVLSGIGTYGVIAYWVSQRRREIGIRMALGADGADVVRMIGREAAVMVGIGLVAGLVGARVLSRVMTGMLFGVAPTDAGTFAVVPLVMLGVALAAAWLPAWQAARVQPGVALRHE